VRGLRPGEYLVRVSSTPAGWFVKSISVAGRDVSDAPLVISPGSEPIVTISFTDRSTEVMGTVRDARNYPVGGATVIAMPAGSALNALHPVRTREVRSSRLGVFTISGLPPGDYFVVALDDAIADGWQDSARSRAAQSGDAHHAARRGAARPRASRGGAQVGSGRLALCGADARCGSARCAGVQRSDPLPNRLMSALDGTLVVRGGVLAKASASCCFRPRARQ
jgi:hypothetical protein